LLDRPRSGERALLLHIGLNRPSFDDEIQEFRALAESAGALVVGEIQARRERPDPKYFVGSGKVDEIGALAKETQAELILVSQPLRAGQERNLELTLKTRVLDRNGLILDIFAQRAATFEAARAKAIVATRQYAKRQLTWLRGDPRIEAWPALAADLVDRCAERLSKENLIAKNGRRLC